MPKNFTSEQAFAEIHVCRNAWKTRGRPLKGKPRAISTAVIPIVALLLVPFPSLGQALQRSDSRINATAAWPRSAVEANAASPAQSVHVKPSPGDGIQYVSPRGQDSNDGLSWGSAKRTLYAALEALPGGGDKPPTAGRGIVWVIDGTAYGGPEVGDGIWLLGARDRNFANPPLGWLRYTGGLRIQCMGSGNSAANQHIPLCRIDAGGNADNDHPAVWLSSIAKGLYLEGLGFQYPAVGMRIGIDSTGDRTKGGVSSVELENTAVNLGNCKPGAGPGIDIGTNTFWVWILDSSVGGCGNSSYAIAPSGLTRFRDVVTVATMTRMVNLRVGQVISIYNPRDGSFAGNCLVTAEPDDRHLLCSQPGPDGSSGRGWVLTDQDAAVNIDPAGASGSGLLFFRDDAFGTGGPGEGIRFQNGLNGGSLDIQSQTCEGSFTTASGPCVHVYWNPRTSPVADVNVRDVESADNNNAGNNVAPAVQVDGPFDPSAIIVSSAFAGGAANVRGPMTVLGQYAPSLNRSFESPLRQGQIGFFHHRILGMTDAARRLFAPVAVRYPNLAPTSPRLWKLNSSKGDAVIGGEAEAPDGTNAAGTASQQKGPQNTLIYYQAEQPLAVGDYFVAGVWTKVAKGYNGGLNNFALWIGDRQCHTSGYTEPAPYTGDGEWEWLFSIQKVTATGSRLGNVAIGSFFGTGQPVTAYAPVLLHIPVGSISDNEAYELAYSLSSYGSSCRVGTICGLPGQILQMPGRIEGQFVLANQGAAFVDNDVTLSPEWGSNARVSGARGSSQRFAFIVTSGGPGIAADPAVTIRFPAEWPLAPIFSCKQTGGTGTLATISGEDSATKDDMRLHYRDTPKPGSTYVFICEGE